MREAIKPRYWAVKEAVFPFAKFNNVDPILGPEMRSTGEVMGIGMSFGKPLPAPTKRRTSARRSRGGPS